MPGAFKKLEKNSAVFVNSCGHSPTEKQFCTKTTKKVGFWQSTDYPTCETINDHGSDCECYKKIIATHPTIKKAKDDERNIRYY